MADNYPTLVGPKTSEEVKFAIIVFSIVQRTPCSLLLGYLYCFCVMDMPKSQFFYTCWEVLFVQKRRLSSASLFLSVDWFFRGPYIEMKVLFHLFIYYFYLKKRERKINLKSSDEILFGFDWFLILRFWRLCPNIEKKKKCRTQVDKMTVRLVQIFNP